MEQRPDPQELVDLLEAYLFGGAPTLTSGQLAEGSGVDLELSKNRWRSLGFTDVDDDLVAFGEADLKAAQDLQHLVEAGLISDDESALIRSVGRSFSRLAEWQLLLLGNVADPFTTDLDDLIRLLDDAVPRIESLQRYAWRRHLLNAASRMLLAPPQDTPAIVVGFADIVGYTRQSRSLTPEALGRLVEDFEAAALRIIAEHGGRIVKTIGDEVMFVTDAPANGAEIALQLLELRQADESFPELRVGLAYGQVLHRAGDVFGPTVNVAARLTSVGKPNKALVDRALAEALAENTDYWVRRARPQSVKGYRRLQPFKLRRFDSDLTSPMAYLQQKGRDFLDAVDEMQHRREGAPAGEALEELPGGQDAGPVVPADEHHG